MQCIFLNYFECFASLKINAASTVYTGTDFPLPYTGVILARAKPVCCLHDVLQYQLRIEKILNGTLVCILSCAGSRSRFLVCLSRYFRSLMLTPMPCVSIQVHDDAEFGRGNREGQVHGGMHRGPVTTRQDVHSQ